MAPPPKGCLEEALLTLISCRGKSEFPPPPKETIGGIISVERKKCWARRKFYGNIFYLVCA